MSDESLNLTENLPVATERDAPDADATPAPDDAAADRPQYEAAMGGISTGRALFRALGVGLTFAVVGAVTGVHDFAEQILPHILAPESPGDYQEATVGLPVPHLLDWNPAKIEALQLVAGLSSLVAALCVLTLYGGLLLRCVSALNPTFRLLRIRSASAQHRWLAFDSAALRKAFRAALLPGLALGMVWLITLRLPGRAGDFAGMIRFVAVGMALWTAFGVRGRAGDLQRVKLQKIRPALSELLLMGAGFGLMAYILMQVAAPAPLVPTLTRYQTLGTFHRGYLNFIALSYLGGLAAAWFGAGALLLAIGQPQLRVSQRFSVLFLPLLALWCGVALQRPFQPEVIQSRFDLTPAVRQSIGGLAFARFPTGNVPEGADAARELAGKANISLAPAFPERSLLLFTPLGATVARQAGITQDGLPLTPDSLPLVRDFLARRNYETALSWTAVRHLYNVHAADFDATAAMSDLLLDLTHCPHLARCNGTLFEMLSTCAATPQNLEILDQYAASPQFARPDREGLRNTGDLYRRFGATEKALQWYRRADMPKTFMAKIARERPMFHTGRITGTLRWNGQPLIGADVAAAPRYLNGLPFYLEPQISRYFLEIVARYRSSPLFGPYHPVPFALRFVSAAAKTDAQGRFTITNLTEGTYCLLIRLPAGIELLPPLDARLKMPPVPQGIGVNYDKPAFDAGALNFTFAAGRKF